MEVRSFKFPIYTSVSCNRTPRCLDWGNNGLIIYGACHAVEIYKREDEDYGRIVQTLIAHKKMVTSVQWISRPDGRPENELISTSADKTAIIWTLCDGQFVVKHTLVGHKDVVKTAIGLYLPSEDNEILLVATSGADSTVRVWECSKETARCVQTISFGNYFPLDVKMICIDGSQVLMAVGGVECNICLYVHDESRHFKCLATLEGHEDWIQSLDFITEDTGDILLASASQDHFIRIWRIHLKDAEKDVINIAELTLRDISFTTHLGYTYHVSLESILAGHEYWIYSVKWYRHNDKDGKQPLQLLSASMDKTMIIWEPDSNAGIWIEKVRVGKVGGNTLGFYGGVFSPDGELIVAHGHQGAIHLWKLNKKIQQWEPKAAFGGHFDVVKDIDWDPQGTFLLSCSSDQSTRLHAPVLTKNKKYNWCELARPQIHGYDMVCISAVSRYKYISSGDEKILRVFDAPRSFAVNLQNLCDIDVSTYLTETLPEGASVPTLGLSNKAVFNADLKNSNDDDLNIEKHAKDQYPDYSFTPIVLSEPPTEELLLQNTLWPEVQKLYGHPYEIYAVAVNHQGTIVASSCKASKPEHAAIILWSTKTWKQLGQLVFHTLTVTQLEFSPDDKYLLSVSRDRTWSLYENFPDETVPYKTVACTDKKSVVHSRIIWSCSWSHDSKHFATGSRDKRVAVWTEEQSNEINWIASVLEAEDVVTAIAFAPCFSINERYIIACGLENGQILLYTWTVLEKWSTLFKLDRDCSHHLAVNRLKFAPVQEITEHKQKSTSVIQLGSCSMDHHVRIYSFPLTCLL